jgi:hypothetical protein
MPADGQPLGDHDAAARAALAGERRVDRDHLPTGACCLVGKDGQECRPARILNGLSETVILEHIADLQIFVIDGVVLAHEGERRLMVKVPPLALHLLMRFGQQCYRLAPPVAALLASGRRDVAPFSALVPLCDTNQERRYVCRLIPLLSSSEAPPSPANFKCC